jgi:transcriptional regulator GlxA family with amidase domain
VNKRVGKQCAEGLERSDGKSPYFAASHYALRGRIRAAAAPHLHGTPGRASRNREYIRQLEIMLRSEPQMDITLSIVAYLLDIEKTHCSRKFRELAGMPLCRWKNRIRIDSAKQLLKSSTRSVTDISHATGYIDIRTFERNFQREVGMCPRAFRQLHTVPFVAPIFASRDSALQSIAP